MSGTNPNAVCLNAISVPPSTSVSRYCTFETTGEDMNSGPVISSSVGRLIACTCPQRCPLSSPRSRNQRPPGHASIAIGNGCPSGVSLRRPICSSSASNVASSEALDVDLVRDVQRQILECRCCQATCFLL